jgi:hypothetical protein
MGQIDIRVRKPATPKPNLASRFGASDCIAALSPDYPSPRDFLLSQWTLAGPDVAAYVERMSRYDLFFKLSLIWLAAVVVTVIYVLFP